VGECRNCGRHDLKSLGHIGAVAPFFLKRVWGAEIRFPRSRSALKQGIRRLLTVPMSLVPRISAQRVYVEIEICSHCSFVQTTAPFRDEDIFRLYADYRSSTYNEERIRYEPSYASIAAAVGQDDVEIRSRKTALNSFLRRVLPGRDSFSILDYGGSDGKFLPDLPGSKFVYEISNIQPVDGVTRINDESALGTYSLVLAAHIIEHVPKPLQLVHKLRAFVEPGGYLYLETPQEIADSDREGLRQGRRHFDIDIHEHINSYSLDAVKGLLEAGSFELVSIERTPVDVGWAKSVHIRALGRKHS
jgi:hypothetical protein